ncbi:MAG: 2-hydroxyacyl-CoA dehydratase family protein [Pseudomonadota bacterium]
MKLRKIENIDTTMFEQGIPIMAQLRDHHSTTKAETMFYDLTIKLCNEVMSAVKGGRPFVTNVMSFPTEIYWAMGIAGIEYDFIAGMFSLYMGNKDEIFTAAKSIGIRPEICSAQRAPIGWFAKGWYPKPNAIVSTSLCQCDNCAQNANVMGALYDVPVFCMTRPYLFWTQKGLDFMVEEIKDVIAFLEKTTGQKMDYDKLSEAIRLTKKQMEISVEIHNLIKTARPNPVKSGTGFLIHFIRMMYAGRQEGVDYCQAFLDEMKERVASGKGYTPEEKYRLVSCYTFPPGMHGLLDWMETQGATLVAEPMYHYYNEAEVAKIDPLKPIEALARIFYTEPYHGFYGPYEVFSDMIINDSIQSGVDGAVNFFNTNCRMCGAVSRLIKDQLREKAGISTLTVDVDVMENSAAVEEELKKKLEQFFLVLDNAKNKRKVA